MTRTIFLAALVAPLLAMAAPDAAPYWVFFTDKGPIDNPSALAAIEQSLHPRALERRRLRRTAPGLVDTLDLPVFCDYVAAVHDQGLELRVISRWLNAASVVATDAQARELEALAFVDRVEPVGRTLRRRNPTARPGAPVPAAAGGFYGLAEVQLSQISIPQMHAQGYTGEGVIIGILDTGFKRTHEAFTDPAHPVDVLMEFDFLNGDFNTAPEPGDIANQHDHGTQVMGTVAAYAPGVYMGSAYDASFILAKVEDLAGEYAAEEDLFVAGLEYIEINGGDVATSSLVIFGHYTQEQLDGLTSVMTTAINVATANGVHCLQGIGNAGHDANPSTSTMLPPADAFEVITVGSVDVNNASASFTSDGPTADGRPKPEVMARGESLWVVHPSLDTQYWLNSGASFATPTTAGAVACLVQAHPDWTVTQMREALTQTASEAASGPDPLHVRGWGVVDTLRALTYEPQLTGDLDRDGQVGTVDLLLLLATWAPCAAPCPLWCPADLDHDCLVGTSDLLILLANWGP